jgi:hypothetical protein
MPVALMLLLTIVRQLEYTTAAPFVNTFECRFSALFSKYFTILLLQILLAFPTGIGSS